MSKVVIGKFGSVHGVKGDIKVHAFTESNENILQYQPWQYRPTAQSDWQELDILQSSWHNDQLVVRIAGFTDRDEAKKLTNLEKIKLIEETIEREIRPALKTDGGDIELIDVEGSTVTVSLRGTCASCTASQFTLKDFVEQKLKEFVTSELMVVEVK